MNPHNYSPQQIARIQRWSGQQAKLPAINLVTSNRTFWRYFNNPLEMHRSAPFLEGVLSTSKSSARKRFLGALASFCSGNPEPIEKLVSPPAATPSRKRAA